MVTEFEDYFAKVKNNRRSAEQRYVDNGKPRFILNKEQLNIVGGSRNESDTYSKEHQSLKVVGLMLFLCTFEKFNRSNWDFSQNTAFGEKQL